MTERLVQFPSDFFSFSSCGQRSEGVNQGRASGGILLLLRSKVFNGPECKILSKSLAHLAVQVQPRGGDPFCIIGVYRADNNTSAVYREDFFELVGAAADEARQLNLPVIVCGDFNAKIGTIEGNLKDVEEFAN